MQYYEFSTAYYLLLTNQLPGEKTGIPAYEEERGIHKRGSGVWNLFYGQETKVKAALWRRQYLSVRNL
jgi:hypothetical protein